MVTNYVSWEYKKREEFANQSGGRDVIETELGANKVLISDNVKGNVTNLYDSNYMRHLQLFYHFICVTLKILNHIRFEPGIYRERKLERKSSIGPQTRAN
jgi:hypothetical protein